MTVPVRLSGGLARLAGRPRLVVTLADGATVAELVEQLRTEHPALGRALDVAIPMVAGRHAAPAEPLQPGREVALLLPAAGG
jgi:molybdopterin converting factor small subunit